MERYEKERALGRGAMGAVFLVRRHTDGVRLALKTVSVSSDRDESICEPGASI